MKLLVLPLLATIASLAHAGQIHVPGDYPTLQAAIDGAAPGDVILVASYSQYDSVIIDKPLTILTAATMVLYSGCDGDSPFVLAGPGSGKVVLGNLSTESQDCNYPAPVIRGGGFDELHLFDATIKMKSGSSGLGHGGHAIDVDVPFVLVTASDVRGVGSDSDHCGGALHSEEFAGIHNPGGDVMLVDSVVYGGDGGFLCCIDCPCPSLPDDSLGGQGGPGVVANEVYLAGSTVVGGVGATYLSFPFGDPYTPLGTPTTCGQQTSGPAFSVGAMHVLDGTFGGPATVPVGGIYPLQWDLPGPGAFLLGSYGAAPPTTAVGVTGFIVLSSPTLFLGPLTTGTPQSLPIAIPPDAALAGFELALQAWDASVGATPPATFVILP